MSIDAPLTEPEALVAARLSGKPADLGNVCSVMGLRLHNMHRDDIAERVVQAAHSGSRLLVVNANAHFATLAQSQPWLTTFFNGADIAFCDGAGLQLAARLLTGRPMHRTTPPEWIDNVLRALGSGARIFWIGGQPEVALQAARNYEERYGVVTAGVQHGYFDMRLDSPESLELLARINLARPNIILVNMGMPRQERWLRDNWHRLDDCVGITAGALVDHAAGRVSRPPRWVADMGLEWAVRLVREPRRLWRRYLIGLPIFGMYLLRYSLDNTRRN